MEFKIHLAKMKADAKTFVPPEGTPLADILVCGEQPGQQEVMMRRPFYGPSGKLLKACLQHSGIPTASCMFTNVLKDFDQPLEEYLSAPKNRRASPQWLGKGQEYVELLHEEVQEFKGSLIIAVGNVALAALTGRWGVLKWRGSLLPCICDPTKYVVPIIHPSTVLRGSSEYRHLIINDLKKAVEYKEKGYKLTERRVLTRPTFDEASLFLEKCYQNGMAGIPIVFDIEIKHLELNCISFAWEPYYAISIPLMDEKGDYFTPTQEVHIMKLIARILTNPQIRKLGQNLIFDTHFLLRKYGIRSINLDDSMIAQHTLLPQLPKGLDMITSLWTDQPYYKDEGKEWMRGGGTYQNLWVYNGLDSLTVCEAFPKIMADLVKLNNTAAYERQLSIVQPCCYMMERGIKVDLPGLVAERKKMEADAQAKRRELEAIAPGLNPQSPKQLQDYFYGKLKIAPMKNKQHKISVDADALKRIARRQGELGYKEARLILAIKKQEKLASTYMADMKFDEDSRIRCSYQPCGTTYSRLSSAKSIFGTGMNMQNWPHSMLKHLQPDEGYVAYTIDLSQAENRIVAYVGRIEHMIDAFETGKDVHRLTASLIFNKPYDEISDEPGSCSLGNGESTERQWGKKANHGLNYDLGYKTFALYYDMPEKDAKFVVERYHAAYPELRRNFHGYVKKCLQTDRVITNLMGRKTLFLTDLNDETFKAAYSCIPQGTVGDVINERGMAFIYYNKLFKEAELLQQVHDSITFQIPISIGWVAHARMLQALKDSLETPLTTHYGRKFVIPADTCMGLTLMKEEGIELKAKKWPPTLEALALKLEESYEALREKRGY